MKPIELTETKLDFPASVEPNLIPKLSGPRTLVLRPGENSIGLMRLALAVLVLVSHCFPLGGFYPRPNGDFVDFVRATSQRYSLGELAVAGFFFLSGVLITHSYLRSDGLLQFGAKRFLRIYPGYLVCLAVSVAVLGPLAYFIGHGRLGGYWRGTPDGPLDYFFRNLFLDSRQTRILDLFASSPHDHGFNGSLWTLYNEAKCYLLVGILGACGMFRRAPWLSLPLAGFFLFCYVRPGFGPGTPVVHRLFDTQGGYEQAMFFCLGVAYYVYRDFLPLRRRYFVLAGLLMLLSPLAIGAYVTPFAWCYLVAYAASKLPFTNIGERTDLSYGIYVYAFPVQQILTLAGVNQGGFAAYLLATVATVTPLAWLSWTFVEAPAIGLRSRLPAAFR